MKKIIKRYIVIDPTSNVYWERNLHYGFTTGNQSVFDTRFTDDLAEATLMSKKEAEDVLARFSESEFVQTGYHKVDGRALEVRPITIEYKLEIQ